jgi:hypothetical protein
MMEFAVHDPRVDPLWNQKLLEMEGATIFHSSPWASTLAEAYGYSPCYLVGAEESRLGMLLPIMEVRNFLFGRRGVSLPFSDTCEPLGFGRFPGHALREALVALGRARKWRFLDLRGGGGLFGDAPAAASYYLHTVDLSEDENRLFRNLRDGTRRNVMKARRADVKVTLDTSPASVREFYRLNCITRSEHGLPPQPYSFFRRVQENILSAGFGNVALASVHGRTVAAAVFFHFGKRALFKYGASDKRFWPLRPNDLLMWEAIRWYAARGFARLCFGRTDIPQQGLRRYKANWGAVEETVRYYRLAMDQGEFVGVKRHSSQVRSMIFRRLPIPLSRCISRVIYRHAA